MTLFFSVPLARNRHPRMQNALVDSDRSASDLMQRTQHNVPRSLWSDTLYFFFVLVTKNKVNDSSLIDPSQSHTAHARSLGKNLDYAAAVVCGSMHACSHLCVGMESRWCARSQGEHLAHRTHSLEQQSGRRRRHSSRRSCEGNGFDVYAVRVQGMCLLLPKMSLYMEVGTVGFVGRMCSLCCCFCVFLSSSREACSHAHSSQVVVSRFQNRLGQFSSELHTSRSPPALA